MKYNNYFISLHITYRKIGLGYVLFERTNFTDRVSDILTSCTCTRRWYHVSLFGTVLFKNKCSTSQATMKWSIRVALRTCAGVVNVPLWTLYGDLVLVCTHHFNGYLLNRSDYHNLYCCHINRFILSIADYSDCFRRLLWQAAYTTRLCTIIYDSISQPFVTWGPLLVVEITPGPPFTFNWKINWNKFH